MINDDKIIKAISLGQQFYDSIFASTIYSNYENLAQAAQATFIGTGFTLNIKDNFGNTPLHYAVKNKDKKTIVTILEYNPAMILAKNNEGQTPIDLAITKLNTKNKLNNYDVLKLFVSLAFS